ncbi:MAG: 50S ribosomal protein L18 [Candidatus Aenigmarchaeota archaeon]|nr:50S ribosomal protein L18 [Candidatus Aenigmarchaeota archaeon]
MKRMGKIYIVPHRRRREGKTDYKLRFGLLKSGKPRFVIRKFLNNILCQVIKFEPDGDKVLVSSSSRELKNFGWDLHCGNIPSAYLTGLLCAVKAKNKGIKDAVLDMSLYISTPGNRIFSALKGALDGGMNIPHSEKILPDESKLSGKHIADYMKKLKDKNPTKYKKHFSHYVKNNINPEDITKIFENTKKNILSGQKKKPKKSPTKKKKS